MTFVGKSFNEEIERQSRYNAVQIEVSFVSCGDKPEKTLVSLLSGCYQ